MLLYLKFFLTSFRVYLNSSPLSPNLTENGNSHCGNIFVFNENTCSMENNHSRFMSRFWWYRIDLNRHNFRLLLQIFTYLKGLHTRTTDTVTVNFYSQNENLLYQRTSLMVIFNIWFVCIFHSIFHFPNIKPVRQISWFAEEQFDKNRKVSITDGVLNQLNYSYTQRDNADYTELYIKIDSIVVDVFFSITFTEFPSIFFTYISNEVGINFRLTLFPQW